MVAKNEAKKKAVSKSGTTKKRSVKKTSDKKVKSAVKKQVGPQVPVKVVVDDKVVPIGFAFEGAPESSEKVKPSVDDRTLIREKRRIEKQKRMEELRRQREAANAAAELGNVASIESARKGQEPPVLEASRISAPKDSGTHPVVTPPLEPSAVEEKKTNHVSIRIPELLKYKLLAKESAHRSVVEPLKNEIKEAAQRKLIADIAKALAADEKCVQTGKELEDCVNEILTAVQPQLPQGYAVVHIAAEDSVAVCKHLPDQVGKRFRLKLG